MKKEQDVRYSGGGIQAQVFNEVGHIYFLKFRSLRLPRTRPSARYLSRGKKIGFHSKKSFGNRLYEGNMKMESKTSRPNSAARAESGVELGTLA